MEPNAVAVLSPAELDVNPPDDTHNNDAVYPTLQTCQNTVSNYVKETCDEFVACTNSATTFAQDLDCVPKACESVMAQNTAALKTQEDHYDWMVSHDFIVILGGWVLTQAQAHELPSVVAAFETAGETYTGFVGRLLLPSDDEKASAKDSSEQCTAVLTALLSD